MVSTRMLLSSHYLHDYSDFYSDFGINSFRNIGKIRNLLSYDACSTIIHALISCRLYYCNSIPYNVPKSKTDRLQRLQNQCARILPKSPRREHITPVLKNYIG